MAGLSTRIGSDDQKILESPENTLIFSTASLWEIVIKRSLGRHDFLVDPRVLRRGLLDNGYTELEINANHVLAVEDLPPFHKDPFDRILVAQSMVEGIPLMTTDATLIKYPASIRLIR